MSISVIERYKKELDSRGLLVGGRFPELTSMERLDLMIKSRVDDEEGGKAYDLLYWSHFPRVIKCVHENFMGALKKGISYDEMIEAGASGLAEAVLRANPKKERGFIKYADNWISFKIREYLVVIGQVATVSLADLNVQTQLTTIRKKLEAEGVDPATADLRSAAKRFGFKKAAGASRGRIEALETYFHSRALQVDSPDADRWLGGNGVEPVKRSNLHRAFQAEIEPLLAELPGNQETVLRWRFGLKPVPKVRTLAQIAVMLNVKKQRVKQIEKEGLRNLRERLKLRNQDARLKSLMAQRLREDEPAPRVLH